MKLRLLGRLGLVLLVVALGLGIASLVGGHGSMMSALPNAMMNQSTMDGMMSGSMMGGGMMNGSMMGWMGVTHHVVPTLFWGGLLLLAVWGVLTYRGQSTVTQDPLAILQRRYAGGEISREQYEEVRSGLGG